MVLERIEDSIWVIQTTINFDEVVCEGLHSNKITKGEYTIREAELQVIFLGAVDHLIPFDWCLELIHSDFKFFI